MTDLAPDWFGTSASGTTTTLARASSSRSSWKGSGWSRYSTLRGSSSAPAMSRAQWLPAAITTRSF